MNPVTELADQLLARLAEKDRPRRFFPITYGVQVDNDIHVRLLDTQFADIVPRRGEELAITDGGGYYPDVSREFDPAWPVVVVAEQWGPYSHGSEGWKAIQVQWRADGARHKTTVVEIGTTNRDEVDFADVIVGPLAGFGLSRSTRMMDYAETGYEGHGFQSAEDPEGEFLPIVREYVERAIQP